MRPNRPIYLDHHATTPMDPRVLAAMRPWWEENFANPHSVEHALGRAAEEAVETAREQARAAAATKSAKANAPLTAAQRRGLARKITSYLKRSGLDCHVVESPKHGSRLLH